MIHKITNTESENGELKCKIQHLKHASTLENELLKTKLEAKCEQLTEQNKTKTDKINKLITDIEKINNELHDIIFHATQSNGTQGTRNTQHENAYK